LDGGFVRILFFGEEHDLAGFAAFKGHCSFFPGTTVEAFKGDLEEFETTKASSTSRPNTSSPRPW
jgi:hypothetical protein